jgi:S-adenosylmethionine hydrolase
MRGPDRDRWEVLWRPGRLSASFHGRDLFAPVAARLARGEWPAARPIGWSPADFEGWADDLARVIYVDAYGNAVTGLRTAGLAPGARFAVAGQVLERAETFGAVPPGTGLWYENSSGLAEIAVNQGSAASLFGLAVGSPVTVTG